MGIQLENGDCNGRLETSLQAGFNPKRIPARKMYTAPLLFGGFVIWEIVAHWRWLQGRRWWGSTHTEERSSQFALEPMMIAERDRLFIKRCKDNRDYEAQLMKDVEGWEVGTYFGVPIYRHEDNPYQNLPYNEFYAHCRPSAAMAEVKRRNWHVS